MEDLLIHPLPDYTLQVGAVLAMMEMTRATTKKQVAKFNTAQLDWRIDDKANSIGMLLGHIAAVEEVFAIEYFEGRKLSEAEEAVLLPCIELGDAGYEATRNTSLSEYIQGLDRAREKTKAQLRKIDDVMLNLPRPVWERQVNWHWMLYHMMEDELRHAGQMTWLSKRLPAELADM